MILSIATLQQSPSFASERIKAPIEENSTFSKIFSCIPFLGSIASAMNQRSLIEKIRNTTDSARIINLIEVKNSYIKCGILRNVILLALHASFVAGSIFLGMPLEVFLLPFIFCLPICYFLFSDRKKLLHNLQTINQLKTRTKACSRNFQGNLTIR